MEKELKGLIIEVISIILLLVIVVPVCANASSEYRMKRDAILGGEHATVDISNKGEYKEIHVTSDADRVVRVNLVMRISKFNDEYLITLDDQVYNLKDLEYTEDDNYQYYNLGIYDIDKFRTFLFKINVKDKAYYDETISYGFYTEGFM